MPNELKFNVKYRVPARIIYETFTNPNEITKFTQSVAKFDKVPGGEFNFYDGFITGKVVDLEENKKISLKWKFNNWDDYCDVIFNIKEREGNECVVNVLLKNVPERDVFKQIVDLPQLEAGFMSQIFKKINDFLGYPINKDDDSEDDD